MPPDRTRLSQILRNARRIAVVGLSRKPDRPSHGVAAYLQQAGYTIIPVHPDLRSAAATGPIDIVNIFRRSEHVPALLDAMLEVKPVLVWMQVGIRHADVARTLEAACIEVVMDRCLAVDHSSLRG